MEKRSLIEAPCAERWTGFSGVWRAGSWNCSNRITLRL